jgi:hypothetical protein
MKSFNVSIDESKINGDPKGEKLFAVVWVDVEDSEDTRTELWRANNEDELQGLIGEYFADGDPDYEPGVHGPDVDDEFGITILATEIGNIS